MLADVLFKSKCNDDIKSIDITSIAYDSRKVTENGLFVCIKGYETDGHKYAQTAADNGAALIVAEDEIEVDVPVLKPQVISVTRVLFISTMLNLRLMNF